MQPKLVKSQGSNEHDNVHAMLQDRHGDLWFATTGEGVYRYDGKVFMQYTQKDGLSSNTVYSMLEDTRGIIRFGTTEGLYCYNGTGFSRLLNNFKVINNEGLKLRRIFDSQPFASSQSLTVNMIQSIHRNVLASFC